MPDNWIVLIPEDPFLVPAEERQREAEALLWRLAPASDEVSSTSSDGVVFYDCGQNFGSVSCPTCGQLLSLDWWRDWMDEDYAEKGFRLVPRSLPCCGRNATLNQLTYRWAQGFAKFSLQATNPNIGQLSDASLAEIEAALGTRLRVIYQHL
jgi:hypothetical protein